MVYRPTVRYEDTFREYVEALFQASRLDRNQILRLALFLLPHTREGREILSVCVKDGVSLPAPEWDKKNHKLWSESEFLTKLVRESLASEGPGRLVKIHSGGIRYEEKIHG